MSKAIETTNKKGLSGFIKELQSLDVENFGNWSFPVKALTWGLIAVFTAGAGYALGSMPVKSNMEGLIIDRDIYFEEFKKQQLELNGAELYQQQIKEIDKKFQDQLQQLPKETEIPGLVDDLNRSGKVAGLKLENLTLGAELKKEFFIEQPISIVATGDFHAFGRFVESVSALPRIVTIQSFNIESVKSANSEVPELKYSINASTYRYLDVSKNPNVSDATQ